MVFTAAVTLSLSLSAAAAWGAEPRVIPHVTEASTTGPVVVAIGDSIMEGHGLDASEAWPALLAQKYGWQLTNFASDGSGFVTAGDNGDTFADQIVAAVKLNPSIVIVSGSSNDLDQSDDTIATDTADALQLLRTDLPNAQIVVVSPVWGDSPVPGQLTTIGDDTAQDAAAVGAQLLQIGQPLAGRSALMQSDGVHPTATGQRVIAHAVARALSTP